MQSYGSFVWAYAVALAFSYLHVFSERVKLDMGDFEFVSLKDHYPDKPASMCVNS